MNQREFEKKYSDEDFCLKTLEAVHWPDGPICPRCGAVDRAGRIATRPRVLNCLECHGQFSVTVGTLMQRSHLSLRVWFLATYMMMTLPRQITINEFKEPLGIPYKTTWHLLRRLRIMLNDKSSILSKFVKYANIPRLKNPPMLNVTERKWQR